MGQDTDAVDYFDDETAASPQRYRDEETRTTTFLDLGMAETMEPLGRKDRLIEPMLSGWLYIWRPTLDI